MNRARIALDAKGYETLEQDSWMCVFHTVLHAPERLECRIALVRADRTVFGGAARACGL